MTNDDLIEQFKVFQAEQRKTYYEKNKGRLLASQKKYRKKNWEKIKAVQYEWQKNNPEKFAEVRARAKANKILRDIKYRESHPELYRLNKLGQWRAIRISKYAKETPEEKAARLKTWRKAQWQKDKFDPVKVLKHRNRALVYAHKKYWEKRKQILRLRVIDAINNLRLIRAKQELYENIQATKEGAGHTERVLAQEDKGPVGTGTPRWR